MTRRAYVITAGTGAYSDRITWPAKVLLDKDKAQALMAKLEHSLAVYREHLSEHTIHGRLYLKSHELYYERADEINRHVEQDYAALGINGITDCHTDWRLDEVDLAE